MQATRATTNDDELQRTKRKLSRWRAAHLTGSRIPSEIWDAAARAAIRHGVSRAARELGLDYNRLKNRATQSRRSTKLLSSDRTSTSTFHPAPTPTPVHRATEIPPQFIEFSLSGTPAETSCVVEVEGASAQKLRLDLKGYPAAEVDVLLRSVWGSIRCSS